MKSAALVTASIVDTEGTLYPAVIKLLVGQSEEITREARKYILAHGIRKFFAEQSRWPKDFIEIEAYVQKANPLIALALLTKDAQIRFEPEPDGGLKVRSYSPQPGGTFKTGTYYIIQKPEKIAAATLDQAIPTAVGKPQTPTPPIPAIAGNKSSEAGFTKIFNGRDFTGWDGDKRFWSVREGVITAEVPSSGPSPVNTCLIWKGGDVADFELRLSYKITAGNSGVQYRSKIRDATTLQVSGYQCEMSTGNAESKNAGLYEEGGHRKALANPGGEYLANPTEKVEWTLNGARNVTESLGPLPTYHSGDWNELVIIAQGNRLMHRLNGTVAIDMIDNDASANALSGALALQFHSGAPQKVQFKDLRIKQLKSASSGPATPPSNAPDKAQSLFNGSTLEGWAVQGDPSFKVEDGCIKAFGYKSNLIFVGKGAVPEWKDLDLSMKVKTKSKSNSGVWIHCQNTPWAPGPMALEIQIYNDADGAQMMTGSVWPIVPITKQFVPNDQWFDLRVTVSGMTITIFIDGKKVNEWTQPPGWIPPTNSPKARLGSGTIGLQAHSGETWFKDVQIKTDIAARP